MSDIIRQLPDSVANQIAAGEVVQRPASVVKELVENSIDAGATEVQIVVKDAGKTLIQVVDNGKGMTPTDARMAFERHATSKISAASDLFALHTMGFRGEALPSICAISTVELRTMAADAELGTRLVITASKKESQEPDVCTKGCNISVRNLFFNVPARRKFLRSDTVELANIMREFERLALVNHNVRMSIDTGNRRIDLRPGSFKQRIADIWKNNLNLQLLPVEVDTSVVKISGFVSRPEYARRRNALQYLIVNGRNMQHPYFRKAIESAYEGLIAADTRPCFFLRFEVDPETIDVNIHPTKQEIKFENEQTIWPILQAAVKSALGKFAAAPSIDFSTDALSVNPARPGDFVASPSQGVDSGYNPFRGDRDYNPFEEKSSAGGFSQRRFDSGRNVGSRPSSNWDRLYADFMNAASDDRNSGTGATASAPEKNLQVSIFDEETAGREIPMCLQCSGKYIITTSREGLLVVDQYRAHVKVLYERYMAGAARSSGADATQRVIFTEPLHIDPAQENILAAVAGDLRRLGFVIEHDDEGWHVEGVPPMLPADTDAADLIARIIAATSDDDKNDYGKEATPDSDRTLRRVALAAARSNAVKGGQVLTASEMEHLLSELLSLPDPMYTPTGNAVMHTLTTAELASLLK